MPPVNVMILFEADGVEDAQATIDSWTLSDGCTVNASMMATLEPAVTNAAGRVVEPTPPESPANDDA